MTPSIEGEPISGNADPVLTHRDDIEAVLDDRVETIRDKQVEGVWKQGDDFSTEQETILGFLAQHIHPHFGEQSCTHEEYETIGEWADDLHGRLKNVKLKHTDEDRILRETFRHHEEYEYEDWPPNEFLETLETFLDENIQRSAEYQSKLASASSVNARLICWGVIGN